MWRIVAGLVLSQIPGAAVGLLVEPIAGDRFLNCWYGAAFSMPFGFTLGLLWQIHASVSALADFRWHVLGYGLFAAVMPALGVLTVGVWAHATEA